MKSTSADLLEFDALKSLLGRFVASPLGRAELERVSPSDDRNALTESLAETDEAIRYLRSAAQPKPAQRGAAIRLDFSSIPDLRPGCGKAAHRRREHSIRKEIFDLIALLDRAADFKSILGAVSERFPRLGRRGARDRRISSRAAGHRRQNSARRLDRRSRQCRARPAPPGDREDRRSRSHDSLERFLRAHKEEGVLQEEIVTIRNERFVVPVISGQRKRIEASFTAQAPAAIRCLSNRSKPSI